MRLGLPRHASRREQRGRVIRVLRPRPDEKGGCSAPPPSDPVSIPQDIEKRGVTTGTDPEPYPQVNGPFRPPLQVMEPARLNLSRWRHGFKSRWDFRLARLRVGIVPSLVTPPQHRPACPTASLDGTLRTTRTASRTGPPETPGSPRSPRCRPAPCRPGT